MIKTVCSKWAESDPSAVTAVHSSSSMRTSDPPAWALAGLAAIYARDGQVSEAIHRYKQALALEYGRVTWRCNLARLLAETGATAEAIREAERCLRVQPEYAPAKRLIDRFSVVP